MNRIARVRLDADLTAKEMAEKLGVDTTTVSNWESGRRQFTLERLLQIAELLNVTVTYPSDIGGDFSDVFKTITADNGSEF